MKNWEKYEKFLDFIEQYNDPKFQTNDYKFTPEAKAKIRAANLGRKIVKETKEKNK